MMRRTMATVILASCAFACGGEDLGVVIGRQFPTFGRLAIGAAVHEVPVAFSVDTIAPENPNSNVFVDEVLYAYRSLAVANAPFVEAGVIEDGVTNGTTTTWSGALPALPLGHHELRVQARIRYQPQSPEDTPLDEQPGLLMVLTQAFLVDASAACFGFETDVQGWTVDGIFDILETQADPDGVLTTHPLLCPNLLPLESDALLPIRSGCVPSPPVEPESGNWAIDYVSPPLNDLEAWQDVATIYLRISSDIAVKVQPILKVVDDQGEPHTYAPIDGQGDWIFYDVGSSTRTIAWSPPVPAGSTVTETRVRVFVDLEASGGGVDIFCRLGSVCPLGN